MMWAFKVFVKFRSLIIDTENCLIRIRQKGRQNLQDFLVLRSVHTRPGDKLQQHVAATDHPMCTGRVTSCSNKVRRHVAATNRFVCTGEFLWKSLSPQQNFVAATSRKKSNQTESVRLVAATKFCCSDKDFHKILHYIRSGLSPQHFAATCRLVCTDLYTNEFDFVR